MLLLLIFLGSDSLLIRVMEAFESGVTMELTSFFVSDIDDMDLVILLLLLPSVNLLFVEGFFEFVDPIDLILDLCRGDDDPGSESVNFDDLWDIGESFDGNDFLVEMELELEWEWELELEFGE